MNTTNEIKKKNQTYLIKLKKILDKNCPENNLHNSLWCYSMTADQFVLAKIICMYENILEGL